MEAKRRRIIEAARGFIDANALCVDTETTGLGDDDEIVEIAIVDAAMTMEYATLVKPSRPIPPAATEIHGITDGMVERAKPWSRLWPGLHRHLNLRPLLAYNSEFDARLIRQSCAIAGKEPAWLEWHCLKEMWADFHGLHKWVSLATVCYEIGVTHGGHRAMADAKAAREVLFWLARQEG